MTVPHVFAGLQSNFSGTTFRMGTIRVNSHEKRIQMHREPWGISMGKAFHLRQALI